MRSDAPRAYAFFTDIHGNLTALEAVLEDIQSLREQRGVADVGLICLGDSFDGGPDPAGVFDTLKSLGCPHLLGNHEDYLLNYDQNPEDEKFSRPLWKFIPWTASALGARMSLIRGFSQALWSSPNDPLTAVHASMHNNSRVPEFFAEQSALSQNFTESFVESIISSTGQSPSRHRFVFNGHSHYLGRHVHPDQKDVWFNCGSVGYPFVEKSPDAPDAPLATWVWVEVDKPAKFSDASDRSRMTVVNRRVPYSSDGLLRCYVDSGALELCAPFSYAIAAQSLFNEDVVYPFFKAIKSKKLTPAEMAECLVQELSRQNVFARIERLLNKAGLNHDRFIP
jgi:hypothetical protein